MSESKVKYPKPSAHPSSSVGNQKGFPSVNAGPKVSYPGVSATNSALTTERAKTLHISGGSGSPNSSDYPGEWSHSNTFGCVKTKGS